MGIRLQFLGGVRTVTGSMHLITVEGTKFLLDCGLFQGHREESYRKNRDFPFDPRSVKAVTLSHAHIDHCGNIPNLVKHGFRGPIYCTPATLDLCHALLLDSAHVLEKDVEYVNKKRAKQGLLPLEPLYSIKEAEESLRFLTPIPYDIWFDLTSRVRSMFNDAGHILGSAITTMEMVSAGRKINLVFSGDIGRKNLPIIRDPYQVKGGDYLMIESTYGGRRHAPIEEASLELAKTVNEVYNRGGKIIIPAFSVGRTQEVVYTLNKLLVNGEIPKLPIYMDSPLSVNVTEIFRKHPECYDEETKELILRDGGTPLGFHLLTYVRDVEESKRLNSIKEPCIIISASGMCEAGRILHHLKNNIEDSRNLILIVGFMAQNTLGRHLADGEKWVRIFGEEQEVYAQVKVMPEFSAHADREELLEYVKEVNSNTREIFLIHGDEDQSLALAERLKGLGFNNVIIPKVGEEVILG